MTFWSSIAEAGGQKSYWDLGGYFETAAEIKILCDLVDGPCTALPQAERFFVHSHDQILCPTPGRCPLPSPTAVCSTVS